jgi:hypothetical protein
MAQAELDTLAARNIPQEGLGPDIDAIVKKLTDLGRVGLLAELFKALPPIEKYNVLAAQFEDAELRAALEEQRRIAQEQASIDTMMSRLEFDAAQRGIIDTSQMLPHTKLRVDLHEVNDFIEHNSPGELQNGDLTPNLSIALSAVGDGTFRVLGSTLPWKASVGSREVSWKKVSAHDILHIGSPLPQGDSLDPILHWGAPLWLAAAGQEPIKADFDKLGLALGGAWVNHTEIFTGQKLE